MRIASCLFLFLVYGNFSELIDHDNKDGKVSSPSEDIVALRTRIGRVRAANDKVALQQLIREATDQWVPSRKEDYYPAILDLCVAVNSAPGNSPETIDAMRALATSAIDSPTKKTAETLGKLCLLLEGDPDYSRGQLKGGKWVQERKSRMERWVKVWKTIREYVAALPEPSEPMHSRISPPPETRLPFGVGPDAVKDPVLRKRFEEAIEKNRRVLVVYNKKRDATRFEKSFTAGAKRQIVEMYSKPPFQTEELSKFLEEYGGDKEIAGVILLEVKKREGIRIEHEAKLPNVPPKVVYNVAPVVIPEESKDGSAETSSHIFRNVLIGIGALLAATIAVLILRRRQRVSG